MAEQVEEGSSAESGELLSLAVMASVARALIDAEAHVRSLQVLHAAAAGNALTAGATDEARTAASKGAEVATELLDKATRRYLQLVALATELNTKGEK